MRGFLPKAFAVLLAAGALAAVSANGQYERELAAIEREWTRIGATVPSPQRADAYRALAERVESLTNRHRERDEARRWEQAIRQAYRDAEARRRV